jgi:ABC-type polysaccharide/polyol phosphate transport system ATPase subunit
MITLPLIQIEEPVHYIANYQPVVRWSYADARFTPSLVTIFFVNVVTGESIKFEDVEAAEKKFIPPHSLPAGVYNFFIHCPEPLKAVSKIQRISLVSDSEVAKKIEELQESKPGPRKISATSPQGLLNLDNHENIIFTWEYDGAPSLCFHVVLSDVTSGQRKAIWRVPEPEARSVEVRSEEIRQLPPGSYQWRVVALFLNYNVTSTYLPVELPAEAETTDSAVDQKPVPEIIHREKVVSLSGVGLYFHKAQGRQKKLLNLGFLSRNITGKDNFWALRDITLSLYEGDVLGIVGNNGAGKSTLLKLLTGVILPDIGTLEMRGRVSALLSLGAGFNPHLSGRKNVYLSGMFMGLKKEEVSAIYDQIIKFSELEDFIDTPIKYYSSGMKARLGFSVAVHVQPEILVVDEVLATGDKNFRKKAEEKMKELMHSAKVLIIASHSMQLIRDMCNKCLLLEKGRMKKIGEVDEVLKLYIES